MAKNIKQTITMEVENDVVQNPLLVENTKFYWILTLLCFMCGIFGILQSLTITFSLSYNPIIVYVILGVMILGIWCICFGKRKRLRYIFLGWGVIFSLTFFIVLQQFFYFLQGFVSRMNRIYGVILGDVVNYPKDTTVYIIILMSLLCIVMYYLIIEKRRKSWLVFFPIITLFLEIMMEQKPSLLNVTVILIFCFGINALLGKGYKKNVVYISNTSKNTRSISGIITCITIFLLLFSIQAGTDSNMESLMDNANVIGKEILYTFVPDLEDSVLSRVDVKIDSGHINRGNLIQTNRKDLIVTTSKLPKQTMYLKGYIGGDYDGERWDEINETHFFTSLYSNVYERSWNPITHKGYFIAKEADSEESGVRNQIGISELRNNDYSLYAPYISEFESKEEGIHHFRTYEQEEFDILTRDVIYKEYTNDEENYHTYIKEEYLDVPIERIPRIKELCESNPFSNVADITTFIKETLHENTSYTLRPGNIPEEEEITEYFLFESGKGYCVHYASTATLMYRLYGIPARYVTGYTASPSQFKEQDDGSYKADITDKSAHAWVELYDENKGWYPVEVTPPNTSSSTQVETNTDINNIDNDKDVNTTPKEETKEVSTNTTNNTNLITEIESLIYSYKEIMLGVITFIGILVILRYRRKKKVIEIRNEDVTKQFKRMLDILHSTKRMKEYIGLEENFNAVLIATIPEITKIEADRMMQILQKVAFGKQEISKEEKQFVYDIYI
ncbi:MAG: transglutaminase domain-containing protein [Coprobacillaceae bacterium]